MSTIKDSVPGVVCTLTLGERAKRELEWGDLAELALSRTKIENGILSTYPLAIADKVEELASRETSCCGSWLTITHERRDDALHLGLTTSNPDGLAMIGSFLG